jgi:hypothetical protein
MAENPYAKYLSAAAPPQADQVVKPADPYKPAAEQRAVRDQQLQEESAAAAREARERERIRFQAEYDPETGQKRVAGGKLVPDKAASRIESGVGAYSSLTSSQAGFQDDYAGNTLTGGLENTIQGAVSSFGSPGQRDWWANFKTLDNQVRNDLFGATLTPSEQKAYADTTVSPSLDPLEVRTNLKRRTDILRGALDRQRRFMIANGYNQEAIDILYEPVMAMEALGAATDQPNDPQAAVGGTAPTAGGPEGGPSPWSNPDTRVQGASGGTQRKDDPKLAGVRDEYMARLLKGESAETLVPWLRERGVAPSAFPTVIQQINDRKKRPRNWDGRNYGTEQLDDTFEQMGAVEQGVNAVGQTPLGAAAIGAGNFLSGNNLDSIAEAVGGDGQQVRNSLATSRAINPNATAVGEVGGGVLAAVSGEALLSRAGMAPGLGRSLLADVGMGAANGAGMADDGSRLAGAAQGGALAGLGSLAGQGLVRGASRAIGPTGGGLNAIYDAGVRPTLGQRVADKGVIGRTVNNVEQSLQSVPILGRTIAGARQEARDQFQVGAFNEALKEVGEQLPKDMRPGTDPHVYAQRTFDRVYAEARSGMVMRPDEQLATDLAGFGDDIATLGPTMKGKLKAIMANNVNNRLVDGQLTGDAYKRTMSDLQKHIDRFGRSTDGEQQALAEVLRGVRGSLDNAARRNSDPESVALLDAVDAGYAKLVRIEEAAARRGGDSGTFTPNAFDSAVQRTSGGVRSKSYLRGDALMQDYAHAGRSLDDTVPDSGTAGRTMVAGTAAGGAAYLEPTTAVILGAIAGAYAPGVRKVMQGALAPAGPRRAAIASQLKKRANMIGSATAAASLGTMAPQ